MEEELERLELVQPAICRGWGLHARDVGSATRAVVCHRTVFVIVTGTRREGVRLCDSGPFELPGVFRLSLRRHVSFVALVALMSNIRCDADLGWSRDSFPHSFLYFSGHHHTPAAAKSPSSQAFQGPVSHSQRYGRAEFCFCRTG